MDRPETAESRLKHFKSNGFMICGTFALEAFALRWKGQVEPWRRDVAVIWVPEFQPDSPNCDPEPAAGSLVSSGRPERENDMRKEHWIAAAMASTALAVAACGTTIEQKAATGAIAGAVVGGPVGAAVGGAAGAAVGHATDDD